MGNENEGQEDQDAGTLRANFEAQLATVQAENARALAFAKAGVDTDTKVGKAMLAAYSTKAEDLTPEKILSEAKDWNLLPQGAAAEPTTPTTPTTPPAPETEPLSAEEKAAHAAASQAGQDPAGATGGEGTPHPVQAGMDAFNTALKTGQTREEAAVGFLDSVLTAGANGDSRVLVSDGRKGTND